MNYLQGCFVQIFGILIIFLFFDYLNSFLIFSILFIFGVGGYFFAVHLQQKENDEAYEDALKQIEKVVIPSPVFEETKSIISYDLQSKVAIDTKNKQIAIWTNKHKDNFVYSSGNYKYEYSIHCYDFKDILSVEMLVKGESISITSKSSQVGGALVGGAIAGNVGALIGGLGADSKTIDVTTRKDLALTINDLNNSLFIINFYREYPDMKVRGTRNKIFKNTDNNLREWYGILKHVIKSDEETTKVNNATEIEEFFLLKEKGIISESEFNEFKKNKLNKL